MIGALPTDPDLEKIVTLTTGVRDLELHTIRSRKTGVMNPGLDMIGALTTGVWDLEFNTI